MGRRARQGGVVPANFRQRKRLPALSIVGAGLKPARRLPHLRRNFIPEHPVGKGGFETRPYTKKRPFPEQKLLGASHPLSHWCLRTAISPIPTSLTSALRPLIMGEG
jgi:hypothetical protein